MLYQAAFPPPIDGIRKPMKPGGYSDSGADLAFILRTAGYPVVTPVAHPEPRRDFDWVFPDLESGVRAALAAGAQILWANTVLFERHPLEAVLREVWVVGQVPERVQRHDDKWLTNSLLRQHHCPVARAALIGREPGAGVTSLRELASRSCLAEQGLDFPLVVKPVRGRGSQGVVKVESLPQLIAEADRLLSMTVNVDAQEFPVYGTRLIVEEYLPGEEVTVTVMPPGAYEIGGEERTCPVPWALPLVRRFNHLNGIAPYNGVVAVIHNSAVVDPGELDSALAAPLLAACIKAAEIVGAMAPIRIDCRATAAGDYLIFDLNMKPNMTGAGRPGRDDQDSLTSMAARAIGWSYRDLLENMLRQAWRLRP